ncbi:MAG: zinc-binding dehydrogenase [Tetrasphaera sp.]
MASIAPRQLDRAVELGIDATYRMERGRLREDIAALMDRTGGIGYDYVVDATGVATVQEAAMDLARSGASILWYGVAHEDARVAVSPYDVFRRELTIRGSFAEIDTVPAAVAALRGGRIRTDGLITHRFPLEEYGAALDALRTGDPDVHKIVMVPALAG